MVSTPISTLASLSSLNQAMAIQLRTSPLHPGLTVNGLEHQGRLLVIGQHRAPVVKDPTALFKALEKHLYAALATTSLEGSPWEDQPLIPVRIYLKLKAANRPYAMHTFTWRMADTAAMLFPATSEGLAESEESEALDVGSSEPSDPQEFPLFQDPSLSQEGPSSQALAHSSPPGRPTPDVAEDSPKPTAATPDSVALALWGNPDAPKPNLPAPEPSPWEPLNQWLRDYWSYGVAGLILVGSGLFAVALSRPCVVGQCDRLEQAQAYYDKAETTLATDPNVADLETAQAHLQNAINRLAPIPSWSGAHGAAQADLQRYRQELQSVRAILQAQATAARAADLSQDPPHTVERWVNIHLLWQQAINQLETVPEASPAYDYAQKKRSEYRANHSAIGRRIVAEEEAEANFNTAIQTGLLAQQRMETANSLAGWQLATKEWQAAIKGLSLIPQGTLIYDQAQAQIQEYQQHLHRTTNQSHLESASAHNYDQAIRAARAAAAYETKGQWSLAVNHWQRAVASAQQIPAGTILVEEGALLLETYEPALLNAQSRLRSAVAIQTLTTTLGSLCSEANGSCTVREDPTQVQITLANPYAEPLRRALTPAAADGTVTFAQELSSQTQSLMEQVVTLSHQVNRPVAIYDSYGSFVARYRPDLGGFVRN